MASKENASKRTSSTSAERRRVRYAVVGLGYIAIRALYRSAEAAMPISLDEFERTARPSIEQEIHQPASKKPQLVRAASPTREN